MKLILQGWDLESWISCERWYKCITSGEIQKYNSLPLMCPSWCAATSYCPAPQTGHWASHFGISCGAWKPMVGDNSQGLQYLMTKHMKPWPCQNCAIYFVSWKCWIKDSCRTKFSPPPYPQTLFLNVDPHNIFKVVWVDLKLRFEGKNKSELHLQPCWVDGEAPKTKKKIKIAQKLSTKMF